MNIPGPARRDDRASRVIPYRIGVAGGAVRETALALWTVPETDTGGLVEHTKALERPMLKELGKLLA